jgi:hypothetical protein
MASGTPSASITPSTAAAGSSTGECERLGLPALALASCRTVSSNAGTSTSTIGPSLSGTLSASSTGTSTGTPSASPSSTSPIAGEWGSCASSHPTAGSGRSSAPQRRSPRLSNSATQHTAAPFDTLTCRASAVALAAGGSPTCRPAMGDTRRNSPLPDPPRMKPAGLTHPATRPQASTAGVSRHPSLPSHPLPPIRLRRTRRHAVPYTHGHRQRERQRHGHAVALRHGDQHG